MTPAQVIASRCPERRALVRVSFEWLEELLSGGWPLQADRVYSMRHGGNV